MTLLTVGAAAAGALLALVVAGADLSGSGLILVLGIVTGTALAVGVPTNFRAAPENTWGDGRRIGYLDNSVNQATPGGGPDPDPRHSAYNPVAAGERSPVQPPPPPVARPMETARAVLPSREPRETWWDGQPSASMTPSNPARSGNAPPVDLSGYVETARVAQCPRCASFQINIRHAGAGYSFSCERCGHRWDWQRNMPWPKTIKVSRGVLTDRHRVDGPSSGGPLPLGGD
jgi:hypothetical protein